MPELTLEELTFKDGRFVTASGTVVTPIPVGVPLALHLDDGWQFTDNWEDEIRRQVVQQSPIPQVNAYALSVCSYNRESGAAQLYRIAEAGKK